jgi:hypothetical protein
VPVGDLIVLRVLDDNDVTIGIVRGTVRTPGRKFCSSSPIPARAQMGWPFRSGPQHDHESVNSMFLSIRAQSFPLVLSCQRL